MESKALFPCHRWWEGYSGWQSGTAFAVNVGGNANAACTTFSTVDLRAGLAGADAQVGACKRLDCAHNEDLMCGLADISVSGDAALCDSYEAR